jgi:hypothetical protein
MHRYLAASNQGPLSDEGLHEIYGHLLDLTKRETAEGSPPGVVSVDGAG